MDKEGFFKGLAYYLMAFFFYLSYLFPIQQKKILLVMTHDDSNEGNVGSVYKYFQKQDPDLIFKKVNRENYAFKKNKGLFRNLIYMFLMVPYHTATSRLIFMDNIFLPFSTIKIKKNTQLIQLWHGTGSIKKFGLDSEEGWIKERAIKVNNQTTHFIVGSKWMKDIYRTAFAAGAERVFNIGCPRTDMFFKESLLQQRREEFFQGYPELSSKTIILYAPTFRNEDQGKMDIHLNIDKMVSRLEDDYVLGLRLHPHIADRVNLDEICSKKSYSGRVIDFSSYDKLNTLLISSDILITDYSSIIYEYALLRKPMIFYSYDLDKFEKTDRGFYGDYESLVPGPVVFKTDDVVDVINHGYNYDLDKFLAIYLENCDGQSLKRLYDIMD